MAGTPLAARQVAECDANELLDHLIDAGYMLLRHARRGVRADRRATRTSAATSWCSACPIEGLEHDEILEMLELFGDKVIPEFDKDPVHSTDCYRAEAKPKFPEFAHPIPTDVEWPTVLPTSARIQLD